ncbi:MAG: hypothetical protein EOO43_07520 [Flavobacterium sp.]|nr:MAG: hypothetical protein EOO43_07520 [Flavobacterium sp.]
MNKLSVDLTNCDKEPIHIPGKVQSHGFLIAINKTDLTISYVSENTGDYLFTPAKDLLDRPISALSGYFNQPDFNIDDLLKLGVIRKSFDAISPYPVEVNKNPFYLINWIDVCFSKIIFSMYSN